MSTLIIFIVVLGVLVLAHEFGHFFAARKTGMKVEEFGFGFPPRVVGIQFFEPIREIRGVIEETDQIDEDGKEIVSINEKITVSGPTKVAWKVVWGSKEAENISIPEGYTLGTMYSLNLLPVGGFCKIKGENGDKRNESDSFIAQKAWKKTIVLLAGVFMNFVLAAFLLAVGFMIGLPSDISMGIEKGARLIRPPEVIIQAVEKNSPAEAAGLKFGDKVVKVNGTEIQNSAQVTEMVKAANGKELSLEFLRGEETKETKMTPAILSGMDRPIIGISMVDAALVAYPWYVSLYKGVFAAAISLVNIFLAFYLLFKNLILGNGLVMDVAGPVGIASIIGQSARMGINYLLNITAMISLSLAAINVLPFPALDGGRVLFVLLEKIIRRPVPMKYEQAAHTVGFLLLLVLIVVVTGKDILGLLR